MARHVLTTEERHKGAYGAAEVKRRKRAEVERLVLERIAASPGRRLRNRTPPAAPIPYVPHPLRVEKNKREALGDRPLVLPRSCEAHGLYGCGECST